MLCLVPTPIGNLEDVTLRTLQVLKEAELIFCEDTRNTKKLLNLLSQRNNIDFSNKDFRSLHSHNEKEFIDKLTPAFFEQYVIYASVAGMPGISDPGQALVKYCQDNGVKYDVLPGANALLTAFVASGFVSTKMLFWGFLPHKGKERAASLLGALGSGYTTVLYESPHRLEKLLDELSHEEPSRKIFLAKELTKKYQRYYVGTADEIKQKVDANLRGEWVVVLEAKETLSSSAISQNDILELDLPKKVQAKLISKITGENTKACYERLLHL